jgi:hypothetical protein
MPILGELPKDHMLSRNYGVTFYPCITRINESPVDANVVWVGTQDGNLQVTRDGGKTWTNVADRVPGVPKGTYVSGIEPSRRGAGAAYVVFDNHRNDDFKVYAFFTNDFGQSWQPVSGDLPRNREAAHVIREDPSNQDLLFIGTEFGAYFSLDRGKQWKLLESNFPKVRVDDIQIQPREHDLILATHGRGLWILDDITPLEQMAQAASRPELTFFDIRPAISWRQIETSSGVEGQKPFVAANPPYGAVIDYNLPQAVKDKVVITVLDGQGKLVRQLDGTGFQGINRVVWDLHYPSPGTSKPEERWAIAGGFFYGGMDRWGADGPVVEPGEYTIKIRQGTQEASKTVRVSDDPAVTIAPQDRAARHAAIMRAYELYMSAVDGAKKLRDAKNSITSALNAWKAPGATPIPEAVRKQAEALAKEADDLSPVFIGPADPMNPPLTHLPPPVPERISHVLFILEAYTAAPRPRDSEQISEISTLEQDALARLKQLDVDLAKLNKALADAGVPYISLPVHANPGANQ